MPISPVRPTCVPPHSSLLNVSIETTRTLSPYFSPNSAIAPVCERLVQIHHVGVNFDVRQDLLVHQPLDFGQLIGVHRGVMGEIEAQARRLDHAAGLLHVRAQHGAQSGVQQMRAGMIAHGRMAAQARPRGRSPRRLVLHRPDDLHLAERSCRARERRSISTTATVSPVAWRNQHSGVAHLAAGFGVKRRAVERDFTIQNGHNCRAGASSVSRPTNSVRGSA